MKHLILFLVAIIICISTYLAGSEQSVNKIDTSFSNEVTKIYSLPIEDSAKTLEQNSNTAAIIAQTDSDQINKPDDIWNLLYSVLIKIFGVWIIVALVVWFLIWKTWKDREHIKAFALKIISFLPHTVPKADINKFSVIIAKLENDQDSKMKDLILEDLGELYGVQFSSYKDYIHSHKEAKAILKKGHAEVLIWGKVLKKDDNSVPKLFWTTSHDLSLAKQEGRYPII
jgi:hypothetical protein